MMYIEHFVLLAGAYNLGFFYFLFLNYYVCVKTRNSKNYTPGLQIQIRIPPSSLSRHKLVHLQQVAGIMPN